MQTLASHFYLQWFFVSISFSSDLSLLCVVVRSVYIELGRGKEGVVEVGGGQRFSKKKSATIASILHNSFSIAVSLTAHHQNDQPSWTSEETQFIQIVIIIHFSTVMLIVTSLTYVSIAPT